MKTRDDFHKLIDAIQDESALKGYLQLIQRLNLNRSGELWNSLRPEERKELKLSYEESFNPDNLISHNQVEKQHEQWLKK